MAQPTQGGSLPAETRVGRTALRVSALGELTDFYRRVVGLDLLDRTEERAVLGAGGDTLLVLEQDRAAPPRRHDGAGLYHNAFRVPTRAALGDALGRIRERWELDGASDHRVSEALYCTDPAGNGVEVYRDFPQSDWPRTEAGRIDIGTERLDLAAVEAAAAGDEHAPPGTDVGHVHLEVSSLAAVEEFYVETLGFAVTSTMPGVRFLGAGGYHHHIGANTWNRRTSEAAGRGLAWFELRLPDAAALDAVADRVGAADGSAEALDGDGIAITDPHGIELRVRADS